MSCYEEKPGKSMKDWRALIHLKIGFVVGVLFVLLTYLVFSQHTAISGLNGDRGQTVDSRFSREWQGGVQHDGLLLRDLRSRRRRPHQQHSSIGGPRPDQSIRAPRVEGPAVLPQDHAGRQDSHRDAAPGQVRRPGVHGDPHHPGLPAVVFALGGLTGNFWHDFNDVLVPLFIASRRYGGEVQLLITNMRARPWWPAAYGTILRGLSRYDAVDLDADDAHVVRCFPHVTVGIHQHKDLSIVPEWSPGGRLATPDFTRFLREVYALPRGAPASLVQEPAGGKRPRLLLIHRGHSRRIMNEEEVLQVAEESGFEASVMDLRRDVTVDEQARAVNSFDALVGVHGAGLTNLVFLPPGGVLIQVVPYGRMDVIATLEFGVPAKEMGLKYLDYEVGAEESTLLEMLGPEHPAIKDPLSVHRSGWDKMTEFYLKQSVRINITRFAPTLAQAIDYSVRAPQQVVRTLLQ
ncbi:unnamed protein product [Urochloa decumbens]|uniref:Glycosyltransferase 61 catalytic domain-containing protein n=1 Tax=Urochloa decumbens TaxID=240449 RepID=A0ABC8ZC80_9POAL